GHGRGARLAAGDDRSGGETGVVTDCCEIPIRSSALRWLAAPAPEGGTTPPSGWASWVVGRTADKLPRALAPLPAGDMPCPARHRLLDCRVPRQGCVAPCRLAEWNGRP